MKNKKMTTWGCGPKILIVTIVIAGITYLMQYLFFPDLLIPISQPLAFITGGIWFVLGIPIWFLGAKGISKNFMKQQLVTSGIFRHIQHPIYCAFNLFYIPALIFMTRSWIGFIIPVIFYFVFCSNISFEEKYLEKLFGDEYLKYKNNTGRIFPKLKLYWRRV